ncbi:MAG: hypothetical protein H7301_07525 [Cryobacterium sp.]|nr:hypothetical protein [Oligoflexia bacterium]
MRLSERLSSFLDYAEEKALSEKWDAELGFKICEVEEAIRVALKIPDQSEHLKGHEIWAGLSAQIFQTPYPELFRMIDQVDPERSIRSWVDLGAAYGRLGIALSEVRPMACFTGLEIVPERVAEAKKIYASLGMSPESIRVADVVRDGIPGAEVYFIYDFGSRDARSHALNAIRNLARERGITVVGRGRGIRDQIEHEHPWLSLVIKPVHQAHYSIYRSRES